MVYLDSTMFMSRSIFVLCFPPQSFHGFTLEVLHDSCTPLTALSEVTSQASLLSLKADQWLLVRLELSGAPSQLAAPPNRGACPRTLLSLAVRLVSHLHLDPMSSLDKTSLSV